MNDLTADLTDSILTTLADRPGLTLAKLTRRLRADSGQVKAYLAYLVKAHYVAQTGKGGRETYRTTA